MTDTLGGRVFAVRAALGGARKPLSQEAFAALLTEHGGKTYYGPDFSVIERDLGRGLTLDDVALIASLDPKRRGKYWLAWGDAVDDTMIEPAKPGDFRDAQGVTTVQGRGAKEAKKKEQA